MGTEKFYVYVLLNQKFKGEWYYKDILFTHKPFYIGIGTGYRMTSHFIPTNLKKKSIKNNIIKSIMTEFNELPIFYKIYSDLTEIEAKSIEIDIIQTFGKIKNSTGILSNLTDGGDGISGYKHTDKYKNTLKKKLYQYNLNGEFIKEWESLKSVVSYFDLSGGGGIRASIKKHVQCKGFLWSYEKHSKLEKHIGRTTRYKYIITSKNGDKRIFKNKEEILSFFNRKVHFGNVSNCCSGIIKTYLGYKWEKELIKN